MQATKDDVNSRMSIEQLLKIKKHIPRQGKRDQDVLLKCESDWLCANDESLYWQPVKGRKANQIDNSSVLVVTSTMGDWWDARHKYKWLDDVLVGVSRLDLGGNTRPISVTMLYMLLTTCSVINVSIIQGYCNVGVRQAQNIMGAMRIVHRMVSNKLLELGSI